MPDISMCENEECPLKMSCYRYTAIPNKEWQSYANFEFIYDEYTQTASCEYFMSNKEKNGNKTKEG